MLSRITGTLEHIDSHTNTATVALHLNTDPPAALAHDCLLPAYAADQLLPNLKSTVTLHTIQLLEGAGQSTALTPRLIAFLEPDHRAFFLLFTTVKNLGPRKALKAMTAPPHHIATAIANKDTKALTALPGVGKRLAETILAELAGKTDAYALNTTDPTKPAAQIEPSPAADADLPTEAARNAAEALARLGTPRPEATRRVTIALATNPALAEPETSPDAILTAALAANA